MAVSYHYTTLARDADGNQQYRLFAIIQNSWYWAIEWKVQDKSGASYLTDFNTGFMNASVTRGIASLTEISAVELRNKFGAFADYIERAVSGYGNYITGISPDPEVRNVFWPVSAS